MGLIIDVKDVNRKATKSGPSKTGTERSNSSESGGTICNSRSAHTKHPMGALVAQNKMKCVWIFTT